LSGKQKVTSLKPLTAQKARIGPVDPAADHNHGNHVQKVALHHIGHHFRVVHGQLGLRLPLGLLRKEARLLVAKVELPHLEGLPGYEASVLSEQPAADQRLAVDDLLLVYRLVVLHVHEQVVLDDAD